MGGVGLVARSAVSAGTFACFTHSPPPPRTTKELATVRYTGSLHGSILPLQSNDDDDDG